MTLQCDPLEHLIPQLELAQVYEQFVPEPSQVIWQPPVVQIPEQESFEQLQPFAQSMTAPLDELDVVVFPDELDVVSLPELLDELSAPPMPPIPPTPPAPPEAPLELVASVDCEGGV